MIPQKYHNIVFSLFMSFFMSCIMSFIITTHNIGFVENILSIWFKSWMFAFVVAFPTVLFVAPMVKRLTDLVMKTE